MSAKIVLRTDFDAAQLRKLARRCSDTRQTRRLLALAGVYDGMSRADAAKIGGMDRQTLRDWVHRFNEEGLDGLSNRMGPERLVPRQYSTGGKPILGRISKRGSKYLRTLFIQAAHVILMRPHNWHKFSFGSWLEQASPRMHKNKLAVALANKLARIAWSVLSNGKAFDANRIEVTAV